MGIKKGLIFFPSHPGIKKWVGLCSFSFLLKGELKRGSFSFLLIRELKNG
jgi:hypothetical protein